MNFVERLRNSLFIQIITLGILVLFFASSFNSVFANPIASQSMTLLAVSENEAGNITTGAGASVTLEIVPGTGRIFIDTYPFSKVDTQVSVRLANEVACQFLNADCSQYDFIYSIKTGSSTIGGPSAGAALCALTVASLDGERINKKVTISGTINSGGIVGAVGGLKEKIEAAAKLGITKVIVPLGERYILDKDAKSINDTNASYSEESEGDVIIDSIVNETDSTSNISNSDVELINLPLKIDLVAYGAELGVEIIEAGTLDEVLSQITNKEYLLPIVNVSPPLYYTTQMKKVSEDLCGRAQYLLETLSVDVPYKNLTIHVDNHTIFSPNQSIVLENSNIDLVLSIESAKQLINTSKKAFEAQAYYSAASYCYGAALNLRFISLLNETPLQAQKLAESSLNTSNINLSQYRTITDLQTYMLVEERLTEAAEHISTGKKHIDKNLSILAINSFATAIERVSSAKLWSSFFSTSDDSLTLDLVQVEESCKIKIQEATQRQNLIGYYIDDLDVGAELIADAQNHVGKNPILCLFAASKAKATYDVVLSSLGITSDVFNETFEKKTQIAARVISEQFNRGAFPIIGYSYYEYAVSLADSDQQASLLYIQYALELSNLDAYLPQTTSNSLRFSQVYRKQFDLANGEIFVLGLALGLIAGILFIKIDGMVRKRRESKNSSISKHQNKRSSPKKRK